MSEKVSTGLDSSVFRGRLRVGVPHIEEAHHSGVLIEPESVTTGVWADIYRSLHKARSVELSDEPVTEPEEVLHVEVPSEAEATKEKAPAVKASVKHGRLKIVTPWRTSVSRAPRTKRKLVSIGMIIMAMLLLVFGFSVAIQTFILNKKVEDKVAAAPAEPEKPSEAPAAAPENRGPDETKPQNVQAYTVPPDQPRFVKIPKFNVSARVRAMNVDKNGKLVAPGNVHDAGWFQNSAKPGAIGGATLLDGHVSGWTTKGVFYRLKELAAGDTITVERGDGKVFNYRVVKMQAFDKNAVDMNSAMRPVNASKTGLNLITCSGTYDRASDDYTQRLIVYAEAI